MFPGRLAAPRFVQVRRWVNFPSFQSKFARVLPHLWANVAFFCVQHGKNNVGTSTSREHRATARSSRTTTRCCSRAWRRRSCSSGMRTSFTTAWAWTGVSTGPRTRRYIFFTCDFQPRNVEFLCIFLTEKIDLFLCRTRLPPPCGSSRS